MFANEAPYIETPLHFFMSLVHDEWWSASRIPSECEKPQLQTICTQRDCNPVLFWWRGGRELRDLVVQIMYCTLPYSMRAETRVETLT